MPKPPAARVDGDDELTEESDASDSDTTEAASEEQEGGQRDSWWVPRARALSN